MPNNSAVELSNRAAGRPATTTQPSRRGSFDPVLDRLIAPVAGWLAVQLGAIPGLTDAEADAVRQGTFAALQQSARIRLSRVLVMEVNAARVSGQLTAPDAVSRWEQWLATATAPGFWESLQDRYPTLRRRVDTMLVNGAHAAATFATRFATDREALQACGVLPPGDPTLLGVEFGSGDTHQGGQTVAMVRTAAGVVVYKPRPLAVDVALGLLIDRVLPNESAHTRIRVPHVLCRDGYGWAAHVAHRYCVDDAELGAFYRGIGHWTAVMRLLGGSDLHAQNLIAAGPVPVVVDCEALFTPIPPPVASGLGEATDRAEALLGDSVLGTGLLPGRGVALGWRGLDPSGAGSLPGEQPTVPAPVLVDEGTDRVRVAFTEVKMPVGENHPSAEPVLARFWEHVGSAFDDLTGRLHDLDRSGHLEPLLAGFTGGQVRWVRRHTESYAELARMLWHPASLHDEPAAKARVIDLLTRHAANAAEAPAEPDVIVAEVDDLLVGDIPVFTSTLRAGPGGLSEPVAEALRRWREADQELDQQVLRSSLISAYLNETPPTPDTSRLVPKRIRTRNVDRRRRAMAARGVQTLLDTASRADDGTATWIAPIVNAGLGWSVASLRPDMYLGTTGIAVLLAGYQYEVRAGRADSVAGADGLLDAVLATMRAREDHLAVQRATAMPIRPEPAGGYIGLGGQVWGWLLLRRLGVGPDPEGALQRAQNLAALVPEAVHTSEFHDLLRGPPGAVTPLLRLYEVDGDHRWTRTATSIGEHMRDLAILTPTDTDHGPAAWWPGQLATDRLGGASHGVTGIGWALSQLESTTDLAEAAFQHEESLYEPGLPGWRDVRKPDRPTDAAAWCHGSVGIGIVAADMLRRATDAASRKRWTDVLRRAAQASWPAGMGANHTACHGELGTWELQRHAMAHGVAPAGLDQEWLDARLLTGMEDFGAVAGPNRDAFRPGLLNGIAGIAYQLLRMHPQCPLPSVLLPDPGPDVPL
ncbi:type 2 lanthipeptide synthetase LanM family protein [Salinispora arenicola]|uniref:Lanthionine synthetase n=1 Tax=Salinispora arenicola TaxID=168697 RepID=A0A542XS67_SALAC|nr:type 2 lanthipeptide synthetase LanM family protein [Salinispora arenicola]MCN0153910.1 type 2 lanthipeptide synthetase LanM family protein [Salinispora arenicola]TQL38697.1 type 2 lantibiotic biosynthesis protein LanM [Salinispora arenicola]GIM86728.1 lanthionine synthetase [Salinispora arenicola]